MACKFLPAGLLQPGAAPRMAAAWKKYPSSYDEVLQEVHGRLNAAGFATKLDLAALIAWKRVQTSRWMARMLALPALVVQSRTQAAFRPGATDSERIAALAGIPGFDSAGAFTSALLAAWNPSKYGVYDKRVSQNGWPQVVNPLCACKRSDLVVYFDHLAQLASELGENWTPRDVDMALFML